MLRSVLSAFWSEDQNRAPEQVLNKIYEEAEKLHAEKEAKKPPVEVPAEVQADYTCHTGTGVITHAGDGVYTIDDKYEFSYDLLLSVGRKVSYTMFMDKGKVRVSELTILDGRNPESRGVQGIIRQVVNRKDRNLLLDLERICVDLDSVAAEFIPIIGDWIEVQEKGKDDLSDMTGEVDKICAVEPFNLEGTIRTWDGKARQGVIDGDVYFDGDALKPGYVPVVGDKVVATIIKSIQGKFQLRALKLIPEKQESIKFTLDGALVNNFEINKKGVFVSGDVTINVKLNDTYTFEFVIMNETSTALSVSSVKIASLNPQCTIVKPTILTNMELKPGVSVTIHGSCKARYMGVTRDLVLFQFDDCDIGRWVKINLQSSTIHYGAARNGYKQRPIFFSKTKFNNRQVIAGQKLSDVPRFVHKRLPQFVIPPQLYELVERHEKNPAPKELIEKLGQVKPNLPGPLTYETYEDRLHTLLNLEEIYDLLSVRAYADDCTRFTKRDEFLVLMIENLSEKRPTLMVGDKIIAKDPHVLYATEYEGYINKVGPNHVYLQFDERYHQEYEGNDVSVMVVASRTNFRRMHHAVSLAIKDLGREFLFPTRVKEVPPQVTFDYEPYSDEVSSLEDEKENSFSKTKIRKRSLKELVKFHAPRSGNDEILAANGSPIESKLLLTTSRTLSTTERPQHQASISVSQPKQLKWHNKNLNFFQKEAVRNILLGVARPLPYIIFGPPGTGKTVTLVETILQIVRLIPHSRLLVATPSNSAADLIALRLINSGLLSPGDLIRLVAYRCMTDKPLSTRLSPYCATVDIARKKTRYNACFVRENGVTEGVNSDVIVRHRIIVGTCSSLGVLFHMELPPGHFTHVIVDEAAQAVEPEVMIPLSFINPKEGQVILAGDPLQLGPVISSKGAGAYGFDITYLDRLLSIFPYIRDPQGLYKTSGFDPRLITRLVYNYRSLPQLLTLVNNMFYGSQLIPTVSPTLSKEAFVLTKVKEILPVSQVSGLPAAVFHGVIGDNLQTADCPSWFNPNEADQIFWYVNELYSRGLRASDIGIISPYVKQARKIRALLVDADMDLPKIGTVEEFQGQEFNVVLLSTVRSDSNFTSLDMKFKLGFLSNPRRVNVAISRAQALMIVVGNPHLLCNDLHWRNVIKYCVEKGGYRGCELPKSSYNC